MDISGDLLRYGKTDNSPAANTAKIRIRENVLQMLGEQQSHVFDAFAGEGTMYRGVWNRAASYIGCDKGEFDDGRLAFAKLDTHRVLRAVDLSRWNLFDIDHHGSPWEAAYIIARRRPRLEPGELLGVILTEGTGLKMNMGGVSKALATMAKIRVQMPGMGAARGEIIDRALIELGRMMNGEIVKRWQANSGKGSRVAYIGLVFKGIGS
jgi:hypothetical protein